MKIIPSHIKSRLDAAPSNQKDSLWRKVPTHYPIVFLFYTFLLTAFFSPVVLSGQILAPGDGIAQNLPAFYATRTLWTHLLFSGFPAAADPTNQTWYPISILFSFFPNSWNAFVISAYILASFFTYVYVYSITRCLIGGLLSGIIYGMGGFMVPRLGLTTVIHSALWLPLILYAVESLREKISPFHFLIGVVALSSCILAGHPQVAVYTLGSTLLYTFIRGLQSSSIRRVRYFLIIAALILTGIALASIQILPTIELAKESVRATLSFEQYIESSFPFWNWQALIFPFSNWGNLTDHSFYSGILTIILVLIPFLTKEKKIPVAIFWGFFALLAFVLALGSDTPLARLIYLIPGYNLFRVPSRHLFEFAFSLAVLAGIGVSILINLDQRKILFIMKRVLFFGFLLIIFGIINLFINKLIFKRDLLFVNKEWPGFLELKDIIRINPVISVPLILFTLTATLMFFWNNKKKTSALFYTLIVSLLIVDLSSFVFFTEWRYRYQPQGSLKAPQPIKKYYEELVLRRGRIASYAGAFPLVFYPIAEETILLSLPPNISRIYNIPSISGYNPLILKRYSELLTMDYFGVMSAQSLGSDNRAIDILSVKYLFINQKDIGNDPVVTKHNIGWSAKNMQIQLGAEGSGHFNFVSFAIPKIRASAIGIISFLSHSTFLSEGEEIGRVEIKWTDNKIQTYILRAGKDSSEWAYNRRDVSPIIKHQRAPIFETFLVKDGEDNFEGLKYISLINLEERAPLAYLKVQWTGPKDPILNLHQISLKDEESGRSYPLSTESMGLADPTRWKHIENIGDMAIFKNLRTLPHAWLVTEVVNLKTEEILRAITTSRLPSRDYFDPSKIALIEEPLALNAQQIDENATVHLVHFSDTSVEIHTHSKIPSFLVLSEVNYPGWKATIDGTSTHIFQTNYLLRGVVIPAGEHVVHFEFKPWSFYLGAGISIASLLFIFGFVLIGANKRHIQRQIQR